MNLQPYAERFIWGGALISAIMILVWLARWRSKGARALVMAAAFAAFGAACACLASGAPPAAAWAAGAVTLVLLGADLLLRAREAGAR
jgi:hypothetical protein